MKALQVTHFADKDNLTLSVDVPKPAVRPASNDVLIRVLACALNPADCRIMNGSAAFIIKPKAFPYIPGMDVCGVVEATGSHCSAFKEGDRVIAAIPPATQGGLVEFVVCDAQNIAHAPPALSPIQAASLPTAGCTALQALKGARVEIGSKLIVLGASGGVGSLVVQMAKSLGATFVAATSTNHEMVTSLGADQVIDYRREKWWEVVKMKELDAIIDCVGCDESWANCALALGRGGRYIGVVDRPDSEYRTFGDVMRFAGRILGRILNPFSKRYRLVMSDPHTPELEELVAAVNNGRLRPVLDPSSPIEFTLVGIVGAIQLQVSHRAKGKIVIAVDPELLLK